MGLIAINNLGIAQQWINRGGKMRESRKVSVGSDLEKFFQVSSELPPQERKQLIGFLKENVNIFA